MATEGRLAADKAMARAVAVRAAAARATGHEAAAAASAMAPTVVVTRTVAMAAVSAAAVAQADRPRDDSLPEVGLRAAVRAGKRPAEIVSTLTRCSRIYRRLFEQRQRRRWKRLDC